MGISVALVDDQALIRGALAALLSLEPDLEIVGEASGGAEAIALVKERHVDVVLMDVQLDGMDGIEATSHVRAASPGTRVLIVTTFDRPGYLRKALVAGATGFVVKDTPARQLADAVRRVHQGLRVVDPALAADSLALGDSPLTDREADVLRTSRSGGSVSDIAKEVSLSQGTVRNHLSSAIGKTGARNRADAVRIAEENGWL